MERLAFEFNKEILFGEIGALIGAPLFSFIASKLTETYKIISASAVIGAIIGASIFFLTTRVHHKKKRGKYSTMNLGKDLSYFTPVALLLTLIIYYPTLYFLSDYFLINKIGVFVSVISSQLIAFSLFLIAINIYRYLLKRFLGKNL